MDKYLKRITLSDLAFFALLFFYVIFPEDGVLSVVGHFFTIAFSGIVLFNDSNKFKFPILCGIYSLFAFACFASMFYSISPEISRSKTISVILLAIMFLVVTNYFSKKENTVRFEIIFLIVSILSCLYLAVQSDVFSGTAIGSAIANKNQVGVRLALSIVVCLYSIFRKVKWWKFGILLMLATFMFLTGSRSAFLVFVMGVVVMLVLGFSSKDKPIGVATILVLITAGIVMYLIFNVPVLYDVLGSRLEDFFNIFTSEGGDSSANKRLELIDKGIEIFAEKPLFGQGVATFRDASISEVGFFAYAHNNYIELLVGVGITGTVIYYIVPVSLTICAIVLSKQEKSTKLLGAVCFSLMVAYFTSDLFTANYYKKEFIIVFAFIYGTYIAYHRQVKPEVRVKL